MIIEELKSETFIFVSSCLSCLFIRQVESVNRGCSRFSRQHLRRRKTNYSEGTVYDPSIILSLGDDVISVSVKHKFRRTYMPSEGTNDKINKKDT